jgi:phosphate transport system permease protein
MESKKSFTGHSRRRVTRFSVRLSEFLARWIITIGGLGTIIAVILVGVFLVWVAVPLFRSTKVTVGETIPVTSAKARVLRFGCDEYQLLSWTLFADGTFQVVRLDTGKVLKEWKPFDEGDQLTACSPAGMTSDIAFGFASGKVTVGHVRFKTRDLAEKNLDENVRNLPEGQVAEYEGGLVIHERGAAGDIYKVQEIEIHTGDRVKVENISPVTLVDLSMRSESDNSEGTLAFLAADGQLHSCAGKKSEHPVTANIYFKAELTGEIDLSAESAGGKPTRLLVSGVGDDVFVAWEDGRCIRVSTQDMEVPKVVEKFNFVGQDGVTLTALEFLVGKATLLAGDSSGRVRAWFRVRQPGATTVDGNVMVMAHDLVSLGSPVTSIAVSSRSRMAVAGCENGAFRLFYVTSEKQLASLSVPDSAAIHALFITPKDNGILVRTGTSILICEIDLSHHHPEITLSSLLLPVWYEGYPKPAHVWQTSGPDFYEPKYGFWPLIYGTLKATFYSLLIGVPLALLAAVYTSEFLHPKAKAVVKPTIEMMASLPSVVLGFLAALVLAPFVERWLAAVLASFLTVPAAFILGAYIWQLLPDKVGLLLTRYRFSFILAVLPIGLVAARWVGSWLETLLFQGNLKAWLNSAPGTPATPGWLLLLLPLALATTAFLLGQVVNPWLRHRIMSLSRSEHALIDLGKFAGAAVFTIIVAYLGAVVLSACGLDPRGSIVGTFDQRNALVVGFMMGFAIIPIIFTIAEDALSAVPEHLRSASLGCGATPWQTATRIIIPTAMSGLFSAVMVGLGRAVGETMIVLMAAGSVPLMDLNIFNGFRTLSATIATELSEAVRNSTHYRTLFLAALTLFAMTFVLNTIAEVIRQRFRRRAYQL